MIPTRIGQRCNGGVFVGMLNVKNSAYAIIMSPTSAEISTSFTSNSVSTNDSALSIIDGYSNTCGICNLGLDAATQTLAVDANGCSDWYIPSYIEFKMAYYRFHKLQGPVNRELHESYNLTLTSKTQIINRSVIGKEHYKLNSIHPLFRCGKEFTIAVDTFWLSTNVSKSKLYGVSFSTMIGDSIAEHKDNTNTIRPFRRELVVGK